MTGERWTPEQLEAATVCGTGDRAGGYASGR